MQEMQVNPWIGKIHWRRKCQPTPVFLSGKFHGQRSLVSYSPWGCKSVPHDLSIKQQKQQCSDIIRVQKKIVNHFSYKNLNYLLFFEIYCIYSNKSMIGTCRQKTCHYDDINKNWKHYEKVEKCNAWYMDTLGLMKEQNRKYKTIKVTLSFVLYNL